MDIRQLRYFVGVVEAGSFTRAAERLHVAQSALSLHVRQMEDRFGVPLLIRDRGGVRATEKGERLLEHAQTILRQLALAEAELKQDRLNPSGDVHIGIPPASARMVVPLLLTEARERIPAVRIQISEGLTIPLQEWMAAGKLQLKLSFRRPDAPGQTIEIARERFCLIAPADDDRWDGSVPLSKIAPLPIAVPLPNNDAAGTVAEVVSRYRSQLNVAYEIDSFPTIVKMVEDRKAFSILTASSVLPEIREGILKAVPIDTPPLERAIVVVTDSRAEQDHAVIAARSVLIGTVQKLIESGEWPATLSDPDAGRVRARKSAGAG